MKISLESFLIDLLPDPAFLIRDDTIRCFNKSFKKLFQEENRFAEIPVSEAKFFSEESKNVFLRSLEKCFQDRNDLQDVPLWFQFSKNSLPICLTGTFRLHEEAETICVMLQRNRTKWQEINHNPPSDTRGIAQYSPKNDDSLVASTIEDSKALGALINLAPIHIVLVKKIDGGDDWVVLKTSKFTTTTMPSFKPRLRMRDTVVRCRESFDRFVAKLKKCTEDLQPFELECDSWIRENVIIDICGQPINNEIVIYVVKDITKRKLFELDLGRQVEEQTAQLQSALEVKSRFLAVMSHEMRTPLSGVMGILGLLTDAGLQEHQLEMTKTALVCGDQLMSVINDILDLTKMEENKVVLDYVPYSPRMIIEDALDVVSIAASQKKIELISDIDPNLPERIVGDKCKLRQIVLNLLSNAIKFSTSGDVVIYVNYKQISSTTCELSLIVTDCGIGISQDAQKSLFQPFMQADNSITRKYGGSGLGLSICKNLCEMMSGNLSLESSPGEGSKFLATIQASIAQKFSAPQLGAPIYDQVVLVEPKFKTRTSIEKLFQRWPNVSIHSFASILDLEVAKNSGSLVISSSSIVFLETGLYEQVMGYTEEVNTPEKYKTDSCHFSKICLIGDFHCSKPRESMLYLKKPLRSASVQGLLFPHQSAKIRPARSRSEEARASQETPISVLIAEDNLINQKLLNQMLLKTKFVLRKIDIVPDGKQALDAAKKTSYDVIFMDLMMPEMDGLESTIHIRSQISKDLQPYIVAVTASAFEEDRRRCVEAGMDDVITKPINRDYLHKALDNTLRFVELRKRPPTPSVSKLFCIDEER
eukprot:TRINITY_DN1632_c0_g1_i10.p1 TRINITY_DN1632_c0_g1~~TRINITY_DN1632_c0_g1_i10.p1  ORF type:complete len:818 (-),score=159.39 TRINITY_DN1632_c0_g1_i10:37-2490(-)